MTNTEVMNINAKGTKKDLLPKFIPDFIKS